MPSSITRLRDFWLSMSPVNRTILAVSVVGAIAAGILVFTWAASPQYTELITDATAADKRGILNHLQQAKIPYRVSADSRTILVPEHEAPMLRMKLSSEGLLNSGSMGFDLLNNMKFGVSQEVEKATLIRAQEGAMENSIQSLQPVARAVVKFAPGDDSPYATQRQEPSASVVVHLKPGYEMSRENIRAVVNLVARAFTGLNSSRISLVDGSGRELWDGTRDGSGFSTADERRQKEREYEDSLRREIEPLVRAAAGPSKYSLAISAHLNLDQAREESRQVEPGAPTSKEIKTETYQGAAASRTPAPALETIGAADPQASRGGLMKSETQSIRTDNSYTLTTRVKAPGEPERVSVSLLLDNAIPADKATALEDSIRTAIGADNPEQQSSRQVTVRRVAFDTTADKASRAAAEQAAAREQMNRWLTYGVPIGLMLLMLFLLARSLRRPARIELALSGAGPGLLAAVGEAGGVQRLDVEVGDQAVVAVQGAEEDSDDPIGIAPSGRSPHTYERIEQAFDANLASIRDFASNKPEIVATLIRSWMAEEAKH